MSLPHDTGNWLRLDLHVHDMQRSVEFYNALFATRATSQNDQQAVYVLERPTLILRLVRSVMEDRPVAGLLGFTIGTRSVIVRRLRKACGHVANDEGAIGPSYCHEVDGRFWVTDPNGHKWAVQCLDHPRMRRSERQMKKPSTADM